MSNAQLPDLLNGTVNNNNNSMGLDPKQLLKNLGSFSSNETHDDWESAFKYIMSKNTFNKHYEEQQQQEDWIRFQDMRKVPSIPSSGGLGLNQFNNMFNDSIDNMLTQNEINRMMFNSQFSQQQQPQQRMNHNSSDLNLVHNQNMSKFFDFHKQQQQQNQFMMNSNPVTDQLNMANLLDNHHRMNPNFMDQSNGLSHLQKQRLMNLNNKYEGSNLPFNSNQQSRLHANNPAQFSVEDDLGFDPIKESHKGLTELINDEQQQMINNNGQRSSSSRMPPPPGFNHLQSSFNYGAAASPRTQSGSKFPFVMQGTSQQNNWPMHMNFQNQNNSDAFSHQTNIQHKSAGFGNNISDWTSMDPAIVSFRQFSQFNPQQQQQQPPQAQNQQPNNGDMFQISQMNQQGFGHHHGMNINMQNNMQSQQTSPAQVFSHSNLMNNYHMNNMANGFPNNTYDKFSMSNIPPPGFQQSNNNNKKTECIN